MLWNVDVDVLRVYTVSILSYYNQIRRLGARLPLLCFIFTAMIIYGLFFSYQLQLKRKKEAPITNEILAKRALNMDISNSAVLGEGEDSNTSK